MILGDNMKKILVYGDSNVWGDNFLLGQRIPDDKQWVNILQKKLGEKYKVIQQGLPGRLAGNDEVEKKYKNGKDTFISIFRTSAPVDKIIIALGTNDLQLKYNKTTKQIIEDLLWYEKIIRDSYDDLNDRKKYFKDNKMPTIIYLLPINFDYKDRASKVFNNKCETSRQEIINYFKNNKISSIICNDLDLFEDGIHLNYNGHNSLAEFVYNYLISSDEKNKFL